MAKYGLTKADMYNSKGECILPLGGHTHSQINRSKYCPIKEDKKHLNQALRKGATFKSL